MRLFSIFNICKRKEDLKSKLSRLDNPGIGQLLETYSTYYYPDIQVKNKFEELYKIITGEEKPDNVRLAVLPIEDYLKYYEIIRKKKLTLFKSLKELKKEKYYIGGTEFTTFDKDYKEFAVVVLNNLENLLLENISHGIGHVKYNLVHKNEDTSSVVDETIAVIAEQKYLHHEFSSDSKEYSKLGRYSFLKESEKDPSIKYAIKLVEKYGVDKAWDKILNIKNKEELEIIVKASF